ncbi:fibronectin type III domain-containing protein [Olleya sp. R77988]|uniref:fibronectin type III domain-containing protein n=1 Tax=Olleya sp. R77988 TaxID=3093875 RepID=UPI0037CA21D8
MKKTTLIILLLFSIIIQAQVINEPANWPNTNWLVTGTYNTDPAAFEADPTLTANFSFDDDDSGNGNTDAIQAESPVIDLTAASTAGETWLFVDFDYVFNWIGADSIGAEYWDADAGTWNPWGPPIQADTAASPTDNFCTGTTEAYTSEQLNIAGFTSSQLSGFKYRLFYDDGGIWGWGFCMNSPTVTSQAPPTCPDITGLAAVTTGDSTADVTWNIGGSETEWQIWVQPAGTGTPTTDGVVTTLNAPYPATGLTPSTAYEVYVRANCGADGFSNWIGPINFTTFNTPPPAPVGVTCASGASTFLFTEDFGTDTNTNPAGWTGTGFDGSNGNWDITAENGNSGGTGPNVTWDTNPGMHLEYEASGNSTAIASAISPAIDLSTAVDGAELSFWMHAFGDNMGTLNVGVSTSQTGPFTPEYTWVGDYQTTADEAWVPIGINLDAYLGQVIYVEFSYGGEGSGFEGDMSIDQVRVETCGNFCVAPTGIIVDTITDTSANISWTANNAETAWEIVVQPAGTGTPTGPGTAITTNPYTAMSLTASTVYEVYILADCGNGMSVWAGPVNFTTLNTPPPAPVGVTCASGTSTFVFTEDFGTDTNTDPAGWTGTGFDGSNGNWDITAENGNSGGT